MGIDSQDLVNENLIFNQLKRDVLDKIFYHVLQEDLRKQCLKGLNDTTQFNKVFKIKLTNEINDLRLKEERILDFYLEQKVSQDIYEKQLANIEKQIKNWKQVLKNTKL